MRTGTISFDGKTHLLCFSVRVVKACAERYGSVSGLYDALSCKDDVQRLEESLWALSEMMQAGDKYAKEHGIPNEPPMTVDDIFDNCDFSDFVHLRAAIVATINNGKQTRVEADYPNAAATQGAS